MLVYTIGNQSDTLVTLSESTTIVNPYYLFVFTNITTKDTIKTVVNSASDISEYPDRINIFSISISLFSSAKAGQWYYEVYEQDSAVNVDPTGLNMVECGKMLLLPSSQLNKQGYDPTTTYKGYAG